MNVDAIGTARCDPSFALGLRELDVWNAPGAVHSVDNTGHAVMPVSTTALGVLPARGEVGPIGTGYRERCAVWSEHRAAVAILSDSGMYRKGAG